MERLAKATSSGRERYTLRSEVLFEKAEEKKGEWKHCFLCLYPCLSPYGRSKKGHLGKGKETIEGKEGCVLSL